MQSCGVFVTQSLFISGFAQEIHMSVLVAESHAEISSDVFFMNQ